MEEARRAATIVEDFHFHPLRLHSLYMLKKRFIPLRVVASDSAGGSFQHLDSDALSERTRAWAHHLKERCASSPSTSSHPSENLCLGKILAGKTRKIAARMFYETLVSTSKGLIDVQQDQPYSDIALKLKPALFSKKFD